MTVWSINFASAAFIFALQMVHLQIRHEGDLTRCVPVCAGGQSRLSPAVEGGREGEGTASRRRIALLCCFPAPEESLLKTLLSLYLWVTIITPSRLTNLPRCETSYFHRDSQQAKNKRVGSWLFVLCCVMLVSSDVFTVINLSRRSCLILAPSGVFEILDAFVIYRLSKKD